MPRVRGEPVDWDRFFAGYRATVDVPSCLFYRELMEKYPRRKSSSRCAIPSAGMTAAQTIYFALNAFPRWAAVLNPRMRAFRADDRPALGADVPWPVRGPGLRHRRLQPAQ